MIRTDDDRTNGVCGSTPAARRAVSFLAGAALLGALLCGLLGPTRAMAQDPAPACVDRCIDVLPGPVTIGENTASVQDADGEIDESWIFTVGKCTLTTIVPPQEPDGEPTEETEEIETIDVIYDDGQQTITCYVRDDGIETFTVNALDGNDRVDASNMPEDGPEFWIFGGPGDDILIGTPNNDVILGEEGNDIIDCGDGDDGDREDDHPVDGGPGCDTIIGGAGDDYIRGGQGEAEDDCLLEPKGRDQWVPPPGIQAPGWYPRELQDYFCDVIFGGSGDDRLIGGEGVNYILGGPVLPPDADIEDEDNISGGPVTDYLFGGTKDDTINGGGGNDLLVGNAGDDTLRGGGGDVLDYMWDGGDNGASVNLATVSATDTWGTSDTVIGFRVIRGSRLDDSLTGNAKAGTVIMGMQGLDTLRGGIGMDIIYGTPSLNVIDACGAEDPNTPESEWQACWERNSKNELDTTDYVFGGAGYDRIRGFAGDDILFGDGDPLFSPVPGVTTPTDTNGNGIPDFLLGEPNPLDPSMPVNIAIIDMRDIVPLVYMDLDSGEVTQKVMPTSPAFAVGTDYIMGMLGDDIIVGGLGSDVLGDPRRPDTLDFITRKLDDDEEAFYDGEAGMDTIWGGLHIPLGKPPFFPDGGDLDTDVIAGGGGSDTIYGCGGSDTIYGENYIDETDGTMGFVEYGSDYIWGDYDYDYLSKSGFVLDPLVDDGIWEIDPTSPSTLAMYSDTIYGGWGLDQLYGGAGSDTIVGGEDSDVIQGNAGSDSIYGGSYSFSNYRDFDPDTLDYSTASQWLHQGIVVRLGGATDATSQTFNAGEAYDGEDGYDFIYGIENVIGSDFDDVIIGSGEDLAGYLMAYGAGYGINYVSVDKVGSGMPRYVSGEYMNILLGRQGNDVIMGRSGEDYIHGGAGDDVICGDTDIHCDPEGPYLNMTLMVPLGLELRPEYATAGHDDLLYGGYGNDKVYGDGGNDLVFGGAGADLLSGGAGTYDVLNYSEFGSLNPVVANLRNESVDLKQWEEETVSDPTILPLAPSSLTPLPLAPCTSSNTVLCANSAVDGGGFGDSTSVPAIPAVPRMVDTIVNAPPNDPSTPYYNESTDRFEVVLGSMGSDVIFGHQTLPCILVGWSGDDVLVGGDATKGLTDGSLYRNIIYGDAPETTETTIVSLILAGVFGAVVPGNDLIESGSGNDKLDGGGSPYMAQGDFISYAHAKGVVNVSLADTQPQNTKAGGWDTVLRFENLIGSNFVGPTGAGDILIGNELNNMILGRAGDDTLNGGPGNDTLMGGVGEDTGDYQSCVNCIDPTDFTYSEEAGGYLVGNDGQGGSDVLTGIERVLGPAGPISLETDDGGGDTGGAVVPNPQLKVLIGVLGELEVSEPGGSVSIPFSASGGKPPYTAKWDPTTDTDPKLPTRKITILTYAGGSFQANQIQTAVASPVRETSYRLTVTDSLGTVQTAFVKVRVAGAFSVFAGADRVITSGQQVELRPTVTGGVAPYGFAWAVQGTTDGGFISATNIPAVTVAPLENTTYVLTVTDKLGSVASDSVTVTVFALDTSGNPTGTGDSEQPGDGQPDPGDDPGTDPNPDGGDQNPPDGGQTDNTDNPGAPVRWIGLPICGAGVNLTMVMVGLFLMAAMKRREW